MTLPRRVKLVEVGPRDGLQNEPHPVPTPYKIAFVEKLSETGLTAIESTAFVAPQWVPQMADNAQVMRGLRRRAGVTYPVLVPNMRGFEAAIASGATEIAVFGSASETFSQRNINCTIETSFIRYKQVCAAARARNIRVRGYISCALGCPYEGAISTEAVVRVASTLVDLGCYEVSLGDTIGVGTPNKAVEMVTRVADKVGIAAIAVHFHDTYGQALANILKCLEVGVSVIDASTGGLGGCPYARGASGNVATEDVVYMLNGLGIDSGVDIGKLIAASHFIFDTLGRPPASKVARAMPGVFV